MMNVQTAAVEVKAFRNFEDNSGVSALVYVGRYIFSASFLGTEIRLHLVGPLFGSRLESKIAASRAIAAMKAKLEAETTAEQREAIRAFYANPENV